MIHGGPPRWGRGLALAACLVGASSPRGPGRCRGCVVHTYVTERSNACALLQSAHGGPFGAPSCVRITVVETGPAPLFLWGRAAHGGASLVRTRYARYKPEKTGETPVTPSEPPRPTAPRGVRALGSSAPSGLPSHAGLHGVDTLSSQVALLGDAHMPLQPNALLFWGEGREVLRSSSPGRNIAEGRSGGSRGCSAHGWHEAHTAHAHTDPGRPPTATPRPYKAHTCVRSRTNSWATSRNIRDPARGVSTESHSYSVVSPRAVLHSGEGDTRNLDGNRSH